MDAMDDMDQSPDYGMDGDDDHSAPKQNDSNDNEGFSGNGMGRGLTMESLDRMGMQGPGPPGVGMPNQRMGMQDDNDDDKEDEDDEENDMGDQGEDDMGGGGGFQGDGMGGFDGGMGGFGGPDGGMGRGGWGGPNRFGPPMRGRGGFMGPRGPR